MKKTTFAAGILSAVLLISGCGNSSVPANNVNSLDDLKNKTIGTQLGTTGYILAGDIEGATIEGYNKGADAIQALKQAKVDAVMIDMETAKEFVKKNNDLRILEEPFDQEEYSICYRKDDAELGKKLDEALTALKADGTLDGIVSHWIGDSADHASFTPDSAITRNGTITMATNAEFPPYESMESGNIVGIDVDMMRAVCDKLGMELVIENMEFDSIITAVTSGKADVGVAGMSVTEDRLKNVNFTQGYATSTQAVVVRAS